MVVDKGSSSQQNIYVYDLSSLKRVKNIIMFVDTYEYMIIYILSKSHFPATTRSHGNKSTLKLVCCQVGTILNGKSFYFVHNSQNKGRLQRN